MIGRLGDFQLTANPVTERVKLKFRGRMSVVDIKNNCLVFVNQRFDDR